jgi:hypothetical protein
MSYTIVCYYNAIRYFVYYGSPLMAMDIILATIANRERAIVDIDREAGRNKLISHIIYT